MKVRIELFGGKARITPAQFLGPAAFDKYRRICEHAGALYNKDLGGQVAELETLPRLLNELRIEAFVPAITPELGAALKARAAAARADIDGAGARVRTALSAQGLTLYPFQEAGVHWLAPRKSALLADEMGLGKTVQALMASPPGAAVLVVCPASIKANWLKEAIRWRPDYRPGILAGKRSFRWPQPGEILMTNYDVLPKVASKKVAKEDADEVAPAPPGVVLIFDEFHYAKNASANRTQSARKLIKDVLAAGGRAWGLSGTPLMNRPEELASLLQSLRLLEEAFGGWVRFLNLMNGKKKFWGGYEWGTPKPAAVEGLRRVMLRRRRVEVLPDLPTKTYEHFDVDVTGEAKEAADQARAALEAAGIDLAAVIEERKSLGDAFEVIAKARKLLAIAKIPAMLEVVEEFEAEDEPLVVFSAHRGPIDVLEARPGWAVIHGGIPPAKRQQVVELFQAGQLKGIALTIDAGGVGFTLTRAHIALFVDLEWTPAANSQAEDRICRIGQDRGVIIKTLIARETIDEDVADLLTQKQRVIDSVIEAAAVKAPAPGAVDPHALEAAAATQTITAPAPRPIAATPFREAAGALEAWARDGILQLARLDPDRAAERNDVGFNRFDQDFGHSLAKQLARGGRLTGRQWEIAVKLARRYRGQIGEEPS